MEIKEKEMCLTDGCYNHREYGNTITYWVDKYGNERFNSPMLDLCVFCRLTREGASNEVC